jgi:FkbM family methyltransferase
MSKYRVTYAQNREDIILSGFFEDLDKGFYVDVGANHPDVLSITKIFYDKGWSGINIEPNKDLYNLIRQSRPRDINLNIGAAEAEGELTLREYPDGDGLSTFSKAAQSDYEKSSSEYRQYTHKYKDYKVKVQPLRDVLKEHGAKPINFMNIDVEGFEYEVIKGNDWDKYRPQVLCIEANHIVKDWRPLLEKARYKLVFFDGLNNYYVAQEHPEISKRFSYVSTMLLGKPIIAAHFQRTLNDAGIQIRNLENKLTRQELVEEGLRTEIHNLYVQQAANKRLRALVKQLISGLNSAILIQIEKLNKPKLKKQKPIDLTAELPTDKLLIRLKHYDLDRYYESTAAHPIGYRLIYGSYTGVYSALKATARKLVRTLRGPTNG